MMINFCLDDDLKNPKFRKIKEEYDRKMSKFLKENFKELLKQTDADTDYSSGVREIPRVPLFNEFISGLEREIEASVIKKGLPNNSVHELVDEYKARFYYSELPNLREYKR